MSQPAITPATQAPGTDPAAERAKSTAKNLYTWCALVAGSASGPIIAASPTLGLDAKIGARLVLFRSSKVVSAWAGFTLSFPFGKDDQATNEAKGYGVKYKVTDLGTLGLTKADSLHIDVRLPRGGYTMDFEDASDKVRARLSGAGHPVKHVSVFTELSQYVNENRPIVDKVTLASLLRQREFIFVTCRSHEAMRNMFVDYYMPDPFVYPYGEEHRWHRDRLWMTHMETRGKEQFQPAYSYSDDNSHVAVAVQFNAQDILWVDEAAKKIAEKEFRAYFVPKNPDHADPADPRCRFYVIVSTPETFKMEYLSAWSRLTKGGGTCELELQKGDPEMRWGCVVVEHPRSIPALKEKHSPEQFDTVVLATPRPAKTKRFNCVSLIFDAGLEETERKVNAMNRFLPGAAPTRTTEFCDNMDLTTEERQRLHRDLMRGQGFYEFMTGGAGAERAPDMTERPTDGDASSEADTESVLDITEQPAGGDLVSDGDVLTDAIDWTPDLGTGKSSLAEDQRREPGFRKLPVVNYVDNFDLGLIDAVIEQVPAEDRARFRAYMSDRELGLCLIEAGPGFGKTSVLAACGILMVIILHNCLVTGPTNVAISNAAARIYDVSANVFTSYNADNLPVLRLRRPLVVRAYPAQVELSAFIHLLRDPRDPENAAGRNSRFHLPYTQTYWLLVLFGVDSIGELHDDDSNMLFKMRDSMPQRPELAPFFEVASGRISWEQFLAKSGDGLEHNILRLFSELLFSANFVCATPACTENDENVRSWKAAVASGVIVDEAGNMSRADLACVWGNCLLPCILAGDTRQLPPTVMTGREMDSEGYFFNRLADDGRISALEMLKASGFPVHVLHSQLRMPPALFDAPSREFYPDTPFTYAEWCSASRPEFESGRILEKFAQARFPDLRPPPEGMFKPVFLHCVKSEVYLNTITRSKRCPGQVDVAMDFIAGLVKEGIKADKIITLICPYAANVLHAEYRRRDSYKELLADMPAVSTIDSYQGKENDIIVVVFGTNKRYGVGFTGQRNRLNVLLTRARCGLVLVGDLDAVPKAKAKVKGGDKQTDIGPNGETVFVSIGSIRNIYNELVESGRVVTIAKDDAVRANEADEVARIEELKRKRKAGDADAKDARFVERKAAEEAQAMETREADRRTTESPEFD
ncbi:uncharacterized protein DNG_04284 [Cephalotrichum gorgonifer]|uniref:DNA2/NAM7 helicase-like C-terminal domain-containing protein n=1 Tax=Cephalotrichum gorgonifer TaxID=2041049 RepID=A0AAE8MW57_9PEZI|nr:uncharacterized protein DNG_04284 [Cephalotrichum gorgonifer]